MALKGDNNAEKIWNFLYEKLGNAYGVAGIMGNMEAESGLKPNNLQDTYEKKLGFTDESYTVAVDNNSYTNFVYDSAGYGLVQFTWHTLKKGVYDYAKSVGKSIGDLEMQLEYLCQVLNTKYNSTVWNVCKNATSVYQASNAMLLGFECPADQSVAVQAKRAEFGQYFYDKYAKVTISNISNGGKNMGYSNSSLVDCTVKSPNHSGTRTHKIDRITPHCVVGQLSAEGIGSCFINTSRKASCNYGIGNDGRVCLIVDEQNRSWCSSSNENDQRAITIECASDATEPYAFKPVVYNKLVKLCADICNRNGLKRVLWIADKDKSLAYNPAVDECVLTVHRWLAYTACPGTWMFSRMEQLANDINKELQATASTVSVSKPSKTESDLRQSVANWLTQYVGLKEGGEQHKAILNMFNDSHLHSYTMTINDGWCATAVSAAFIACGLAGKSKSNSLFECVECSCSRMVDAAKVQGIWVENDAYTPNVGDVIVYDWDDNGSGDNVGTPDHVGIVVNINGSTIRVIEGNMTDSVGYRNISVNGKFIRGYIIPKYSQFASNSSPAPIVMPTEHSTSYNVGDVVIFNGSKHYANSNATTYSACKGGKAKVTSVNKNGKHPYHLIAEKNGGSSVYGWVDIADISGKVIDNSVPSSVNSSTSATIDYAESYNKSLIGAYKTTDNLNLRCGAGTNKSILCQMPKGSIVKNYGYYSTYGGVKWYYISYTDKNGKSWLGFCSSAYLIK